MMNGYAGHVLFVDLTTRKTKSEETNWSWAAKYIGGKGLGARYLYDLLKPRVDSLSPENVLIFMTGPLSGTLVPAFAKYATISKSPATGTFLDCYVGGHYMAEMKFAGFDAFVFLGRADKPSYVHVEDGNAEVRSATHLWGKGAFETTNTLKEELEHPQLKVATVGPAGENLVRFACITSELSETSSHQAARGGIGAVMGSKNLKAVTVFGTDREQSYADPDGFREFFQETVKREILENPDEDWARHEGTPIIVAKAQETGLLPTKNFQEGRFDRAENIDSDAMRDRIFVKKANCFRCPISCRNISEVRTGPYKGLTIDGPEYETIAMTGSNCGIGDLNLIVRFNSLCDDLGLDTISAGVVTAFAMECYERGIVSQADLNGFSLNFGDEEAYLEMPALMANRERVGDILAEGVMRASERLGDDSKRFAVHIKGLEFPAYDPRGSIGMALAYATSDRGACHLRAWPVGDEAFGDLDPFTTEGKAKLVIDGQHRNAAKWCLIGCDFYAVDYPTMSRFYSLVTGREMTSTKLATIGERVWNLTRLFNVREGFSRKHDTVPYRITHEPLKEGPPKGRVVEPEDFQKMLDEYYSLRGWSQDGIPTGERLTDLGIQHLAEGTALP